jgi:pimeloyl-ACP methyl ester carboxylesterase
VHRPPLTRPRKGTGILAKAALALLGTAVLLLAGLTVLGWAQRAAATIPPGAPGRHVVVDGTKVRYVQAGAGPDVLLVHGSPGSAEDWEPVIERLSARFRVTAFDRPGYGYSGGEDRPHTPGENAAVALGLIRALGLRDVVFVGHSYGGTTALALALRDPPEVRSFVVVGSRAYAPVEVDRLYKVLAVPLLGRGLAAAVSSLVGPARVEAGVRDAFGPNTEAIPAGFVASRTAQWTRPTVSATLSEERVTLGEALAGAAPRYASIRKPVVVVCGDQDGNHADARRLARDIPGARLVLLPDTGHYVQYARPEALVAAIEDAAAAPPGAVP